MYMFGAVQNPNRSSLQPSPTNTHTHLPLTHPTVRRTCPSRSSTHRLHLAFPIMGDPATLCYTSTTCSETPGRSSPTQFIQACSDSCQFGDPSYGYFAWDGNNCECFSTCTPVPNTSGYSMYLSGALFGQQCPALATDPPTRAPTTVSSMHARTATRPR